MSREDVLKLLLVTSNYPRWTGDSTTPFVHSLAKDLVAKGHQVTVLAPHFEGAALKEDFDGVQVRRFRYFWPVKAQTVCYQGGALVNLRKKPIEKLKLPMLVLAECFAVFRLLLTQRYDVINAHWIIPQGFAALVSSWLFRVPVVTTVHGGDIFSLKGKLMLKFKRWVLRRSAAISVNSSFTEAAVNELQMSSSGTSVHRIPMGVTVSELPDPEEVSQLRSSLQDHPEQKLLVFVGRVIEEKGVFEALEATRLLLAKGHQVKLVVIGEGQDKAELEQRIARANLEAAAQTLGWVDHSQVQHYMAAADAFLGPSKQSASGWVEAQGLTFLEAMAAGAVVVGSRSGGIVDSIEHGHSGYLCEPASATSLADTLEQALALDDDGRQQLVANARSRVEAMFSREISAARFEHLFRQVSGVTNDE
ncbi:glycosyltransferase family 4 protein [Neiella sp. HB171785]|uniref:Glycosyltransferase family 4 protein n=1 Tax=Neiella litorisoli TaxID=2771431 RepID=A0A8J6QIE1_9GAMM|nr:glycosyltransferase family 4 protein [Neiella litorisoli]